MVGRGIYAGVALADWDHAQRVSHRPLFRVLVNVIQRIRLKTYLALLAGFPIRRPLLRWLCIDTAWLRKVGCENEYRIAIFSIVSVAQAPLGICPGAQNGACLGLQGCENVASAPEQSQLVVPVSSLWDGNCSLYQHPVVNCNFPAVELSLVHRLVVPLFVHARKEGLSVEFEHGSHVALLQNRFAAQGSK